MPGLRTVPVVALTGALGAGKTTVLNHLLAHRDGRRIGVLVNDFGAVDVDALLVEAGSAATLSLAGGCLCCRVDEDSLESTVRALTSGRTPLDLVVLEASGVADPSTLARRLADVVRHPGRLTGQVLVVDALAWDRGERPSAADLHHAGLVALTKTDVPGATSIEDVRDALPAGVTVVEAPHGALDPALFVDAPPPPTGPRQLSLADALTPETTHSHTPSVAWEHDGPVHPRRLVEVIGSGLPGAYRVKGVVRLDVPQGPRWWVVHRVGGRVSAGPAPRAAPTSRMVALGPDLDEQAARSALGRLRRDPREGVAPADFMGWWPWVPDALRPDWARTDWARTDGARTDGARTS